jgi:N-acylneuraminate cytidylyltransferase
MRIAVIPARGGSRRIPRKNIRLFAGRPMITYSIRVAVESGCFDRVVVSTDDDEIAAVARQAGAEVPFVRPSRLADDHTGTIEVMQHAVERLATDRTQVSHVCCIYATAPFLTPEALREGFDALLASGRSYAFSVARFDSPIQRALRIRPDGAVEPIWPENAMVRSQDLEPAYHDAGQFYWGTVEAWTRAEPIHSAVSVPVVLPSHRVQDIDTEEDWVRAEYLFAALAQEPA